MKRYCLAFVVIILCLCSCTRQEHPTISYSESESTLETIPTYEEIYPTEIFKNNTAIHSFSTSAYDNAIVSYLNECIQIIDPNNNCYIHELCHDPTCNHSNLDCLKYASRACINAIYHDSVIYFNRYIQKNSGLSEELIAYDLKTSDYLVIQEGDFFTLLCRMGKYIYYCENVFLEQLDSGEVKYSSNYYRYDIQSNATTLLHENSTEPAIYSLVAHDSYIYGLNYVGDLIAYDANFKFHKTVLTGKNISTYTINDGVIYYLSKTSENNDSGELYQYTIDSDENKLLAENVILFSLDGNLIYYTIYNPVPAFEWDYPVKNKDGIVDIRADGQHQTSRVMIESLHGNEIFTYDIHTEDGNVQCYPIGTEEIFLGNNYYVLNGQIFSQFKSPYSEGDKLGMRTGIGVFDLENNFNSIIEYYRIY